jgi:hypothetical protein
MVLSVYSSKAAAKNAIGYFRYVSSACWDFFRSRASRCAMDSFCGNYYNEREIN